jgi:adenylate kinase family enzyme
MHINIFGASGSGVTTLGNALSARISFPYFDADSYFWLPSDPPFNFKRPPAERNELINQQMSRHNNWVLGGSVVSWHNSWVFDLSVFLYVPNHVRMERLKRREFERYGDIIYTDAERNKQYHAFIDWATGYDDNSTQGRTLKVHQDWMNKLQNDILIIDGDTTVEERVEAVLAKMEEMKGIK